MKKLIAFTMIMAAFGLSASAQVERKIDSSKRAKMMQRHRGADKSMLKGVNLTDAQKQQLKSDREASKAQIEAIKNDASLSQEQKHEKMKALQAEQKQKMQALLTPEQKKQIEANKAASGDRAERAKKMVEHKKDMYKDLNLSEDQKAKMKAQQAETKSKLDAIRSNTSLTEEQKKAQAMEVMKSAKESQKSILTAEQQAKMKAMKKERKHDGKKFDGKMKRKPVATS